MQFMETFWNWLMRANAKALFIIALLAFIGITTWRVWIEVQALRPKTEPPPVRRPTSTEALELPAYRELGLLRLISNQLARADATIPVSPFRPAFDDLLAEWAESADLSDDDGVPTTEAQREAAREEAAQREVAAKAEAEREAAKEREAQAQRQRRERERAAPPPPRLTYRGLFKRTDERTAAWIHDSSTDQLRFYPVGESLHGLTVTAADLQSLTLTGGDAAEHRVALGETLEVPTPEDE